LLYAVGYVYHLFNAVVHILLYIHEYVIKGTEVPPASSGIFDVLMNDVYMWCVFVQGSYPGDPIKKPLDRFGRWPSKGPSRISGGWKFACDKESADVTNAKYSTFPLLGESVGRQMWYKDSNTRGTAAGASEEQSFDASVNPNSGDKLFRAIKEKQWKGVRPDTSSAPANARDAARKGLQYYQMLQCEDGHWAGDYGGPMFLMPGLIAVMYISGDGLDDYKKAGMIEYLKNHQQVDGGWGTHIECASTMFGTVLSYIALRLLGVSADEDFMKEGLKFIHHYGGALFAPSWAKFWMAVLGIYEWDGINSIPAELFWIPHWFPFHPGKLWYVTVFKVH
jgi:hypothetical protein